MEHGIPPANTYSSGKGFEGRDEIKGHYKAASKSRFGSLETWRTIYGMARAFAHLLGTIAMLLTSLLWLSLLDAGRADRFVDNLAGARNEYMIVLGAGLLAVVLLLVAAIRGAKWWLFGLAFSVATLGFFTYALSR